MTVLINFIEQNVRVFRYVVVECDREGSVRDGPHGVPGRISGRQDAPATQRGLLVTPGPMGHPSAWMPALPQGRPPPIPQRPYAEVRLTHVDATWLTTHRRPQRLQNDQGHFPQGGIHWQTPD